MAEINVSRWLLGGVVAGIVIWLLEGVDGLLYMDQAQTSLERIGLSLGHDREPVGACAGRCDRAPSPPRSWAKTAGFPQVHVSDARDRRDGLRQARV